MDPLVPACRSACALLAACALAGTARGADGEEGGARPLPAEESPFPGIAGRDGRESLVTLHDAHGRRGPELLRGAPDPVIAERLPEGVFTLDTHAFLLRRAAPIAQAARLVLFDTGNGPARGGRLLERLAALGVSPDDIGSICITHMHGDHVGGLLDAEGRPAFPEAKVYIHRDELAYWLAEDGSGREPAAHAKAIVDAYGGRIARFEWGTDAYGRRIDPVEGEDAPPLAEAAAPPTRPPPPAMRLLPLIEAVALPGHTPGHTGFMVLALHREPVFLWGDLMHCPPVQLPHPEVNMSFDLDPGRAAETRRAWLERAAAGKWTVAGMHVPFPGYGRIKADGDGFALMDPSAKE